MSDELPPGLWSRHLECVKRMEAAENIVAALKDKFTPQDIGRAVHIHELERLNKELKLQLTIMRQCAERHNREQYATGLIVHCTGCVAGAPAHHLMLTEDKVQEVERIAARLRTWWNNNKGRI
jgi:hypothetical protein